MHAQDPGTRFCCFVTEQPEMPSTAVKLGAWLLGIGSSRGFPLAITRREIEFGKKPAGLNRRSIVKAIEWLEANGVIDVQQGQTVRSGSNALVIDWRL